MFPSHKMFCFTQFHAFFFTLVSQMKIMIIWKNTWNVFFFRKMFYFSQFHRCKKKKQTEKCDKLCKKFFFLKILFYFSLLLFHSGSLMILFSLNFFLSGFTHEKFTISHMKKHFLIKFLYSSSFTDAKTFFKKRRKNCPVNTFCTEED